MADPLLQLAAGCALLASDSVVVPYEGGWRETVTYDVKDEGGCPGLDVVLPRDVHLRERAAVLRMSDDTKRKLDPQRWELTERGLDDVGMARLPVPEMKRRDRVVVELVLDWDRPDYPGKSAAPEIAIPPVGIAKPLKAPEAWERAATLLWIPRGVDGSAPVSGDAALRRGAADDRGFAATVAAIARQGGAEVEVGYRGEAQDAEAPAVAVWFDGDRHVLLAHPDDPHADGPVWTPRGVVQGVRTDAKPPERPEAAPPKVERVLRIDVPPGDVQSGLYPGGGSALETSEEVIFDPADAARTWLVPVPEGIAATAVVEPEGAATVRIREDAVVIVVPPSDERAVVRLSWREPDAPACGIVTPRAGEDLSWTVQAADGRVRTEGSAWSLSSWGGQPVMPDRASVVKGLDWRFARQSLPEPALPLRLKGRVLDESLIADLRPTLLERVEVADLPGDTLWPRKLYRARRSEVVTPLEAALILRLYAMQVRVPATWAMVRPAELGPADEICPIGYDDALLVVQWEEQYRWIDPACSVCGPYELRPHLEGAAAYGNVPPTTPPPTPGKRVVRATADGVAVGLAGPAALLERLWLQDVAPDDRAQALAERWGGEGATLERSEGLEVAGEPVKLLIKGGTAVDPLRLPAPEADGTTWAGWVGERRLERPVGAVRVERATYETPHGPVDGMRAIDDAAPVDLNLGAIHYVRKVEEGRLVEILDVRDRRIPAAEREALVAARAGKVTAEAPEPWEGILRDGSVVQVIGVHANIARIERDKTVTTIPRTDVQAIPLRARLTAKRATVAMRADPKPKGKLLEEVPVAGDPVWVLDVKEGWAFIDVEGPLSVAGRRGWVEIASIVPAPQADPMTLGDLTLASWTPFTADRVVLDEPITLRGLPIPAGASLHLGPSGMIRSVELLTAAELGGAALPGGSRLELAQGCDFSVVPSRAVTIASVEVKPEAPACLIVSDDQKLVPAP